MKKSNIAVYKIEMSGPEDISSLDELVKNNELSPKNIVAILGKTEGNGNVNDFTRGYSTLSFKNYLAEALNLTEKEISEKIAFVMSGGTEGIMSPHATIFTKEYSDVNERKKDAKYLDVEVGFTREFLPEEIGTMIMVEEVEKTIIELMEKTGMEQDDVHFVQIKCPLLTSERIKDALSRNKKVVVSDTYKSMGFSRAASALGIACALNEVNKETIENKDILFNQNLYSSVASTSAGVELMNCEIIIMGNTTNSISNFKIGHSVMEDAIDSAGVLDAMRKSGLTFDVLPTKEDKKKIVNILAKAEVSPDGYVKGRRTTMLTDSDISHTRYARAVVNAVIASLIDDPMVYVSGGAEHQGPAGGGPVAVIIKSN